MALHRTLSYAALAAATFIFVDSAYTQPRAADKPSATASGAQAEMHDKMHGDKSTGGKDDKSCMGMMDKHKKMAKDHDHDKTAAADDKAGGCDMMKKKQ